jgi:hypothetical protein
LYYYLFVSPRAATKIVGQDCILRAVSYRARRFCFATGQRVANPLQVINLPHNLVWGRMPSCARLPIALGGSTVTVQAG